MIGRVLPVILILIAGGLFVGYISPQYNAKVIPLQEQIREYDSALAAANDFKQKEAQLAADRAAIPADSIARIESYLPDGVDNVQLILDLNALAARSGVQLSNFNVKNSTGQTATGLPGDTTVAAAGSNQQTDSLDLSVRATGTYSAFRAFLAGTEKSLRPLDLVQMVLTDSQTGVYTYDMTFRIYWLH